MKLINKKQYQQLVRKAKFFADYLSGDAGYESPEVNLIALESCLIGWMTAQPYWYEYVAYCKVHHVRENCLQIAQDQALQAACDVVGSHHRFNNVKISPQAESVRSQLFQLL